MIYDRLNLKRYGLNIELNFYDKVTIVTGDSGVGKSLLFEIINAARELDKYNNIVCINYRLIRSMRGINTLDFLTKNQGCFIVIDNSELLIHAKEKDFIMRDEKSQYLLFGRDTDKLVNSRSSLAELKVENNKLQLIYKERDRFGRDRRDLSKYEHIILPKSF